MYNIIRIAVTFPNGDKLSKKEGFIASDINEPEAEREKIRCNYGAESVSFTYEEVSDSVTGNEIKRVN
jgi:hypothetical protein